MKRSYTDHTVQLHKCNQISAIDDIKESREATMTCAKKIKTGPGVLLTVMIALVSFMCGPVNGMNFMPDPAPPSEEPAPQLSDIVPGPFHLAIRLSNFSRNYLLVPDQSGSIYAVKKVDPSVAIKLFEVDGLPVAAERYGNTIIVANKLTGALELYNRQGKLRRALNTEPLNPSDMARHGRIIFALDSASREIKVFRIKRRNSFLFSFGKNVLISPTAITLDKRRRIIYVSDSGVLGQPNTPAVHIFTYRGEYMGKIKGMDFDFYQPQGVEYSNNQLYVVDIIKGQVSVIDLPSMSYRLIGVYGTKPGELYLPTDIKVFRNDRHKGLYILNSGQGKVEKMDLEG